MSDAPVSVHAARRIGEHVLRALAVGALAVAAWQRLAPAPAPAAAPTASVAERGLPDALQRWTATPTPTARLTLDSLPDARTRSWLRALQLAGTPVEWRAARAPALAVSAEPTREPDGGVQLAVAAPAGAPLAVRDALGPLDSTSGAAGGARFALGAAGVGLRVRTAGAVALLDAPAPVRSGAVLVLARAGWEGKFVAAALEEAGWTVRTRFTLAPRITVAGGGDGTGTAVGPADAPAPVLDTASLAAVVALDSSAAPLAASIAAFVRRGGGVVLAGEAALAPELAPLASALLDAPVRDGTQLVRALGRPRADAVPLAHRTLAGRPVLVAAARRVGAGRAVQLLDEESWRLRLAGGDDAPAEHRAWWSRAVAAAAYAPTTAAVVGDSTASPLDAPRREPAPFATTVAALGAPATAAWPAAGRAPAAPTGRRLPAALLIGTALAALLTEVASRRWRGQG